MTIMGAVAYWTLGLFPLPPTDPAAILLVLVCATCYTFVCRA